MEFDKKKIEQLLDELKNNKDMENRVTQELMRCLDKMPVKELTEFYKVLIESRGKHIEFLSKIIDKKDLEDK